MSGNFSCACRRHICKSAPGLKGLQTPCPHIIYFRFFNKFKIMSIYLVLVSTAHIFKKLKERSKNFQPKMEKTLKTKKYTFIQKDIKYGIRGKFLLPNEWTIYWFFLIECVGMRFNFGIPYTSHPTSINWGGSATQ